MRIFSKGIKLVIIIAVLLFTAATGYGATFTYTPDSLDLTIEPGTMQVTALNVGVDERLSQSVMIWFMSEVVGGNLPADWLSVSPGSAFLNSRRPFAMTMLSIQVPPGTLSGVYSGSLMSAAMAAHGVLEPGLGLPISVRVGNGCSTLPEIVVSSISPEVIWPPNHKMDTVTVSGSVETGESCSLLDLFYSIQDEYGVHSGTGSVTIEAGNGFTVDIPVEASRDGNDKDGRHYTIMIFARNEAGTGTSLNLQSVVPHDMRKK